MVSRRQRGFTYLTALFLVALLAAGLALAGETWETSLKREREAELLFIGHQYRRAIALYYESTPGGIKRYPRTLEELLSDPRQPALRRHLRKLYRDPFGGTQWGLVKAPDGGISGVFSLSNATPLKHSNFRPRDAGFESAKTYRDWQFTYSPAGAGSAPRRPPSRPPA
jgi:type II secretory pathway pseudopilin PulG